MLGMVGIDAHNFAVHFGDAAKFIDSFGFIDGFLEGREESEGGIALAELSGIDGIEFGVEEDDLKMLFADKFAGNFEVGAGRDLHIGFLAEEIRDSADPLDQLENFITSGMDVIIVQPVDPDAIEDVCKQALDAGIEVVCWDEEMTNSSFNWVIKNYDLGCAIGEQAAEFIADKFSSDEEVETVVLGYPQTPILLERENGIIDTLKEKAPNAKIVANQPAIDTTEGLNAMETILQANPDVKVVCTIGGGGAAGANEALKGYYGDKVPDDVGIFSTDLTDECIASMQNGEFNRSCIAITGNAYVCGDVVYDLAMQYAAGVKLDHDVYRDLVPVTPENLDEMIAHD